MSIGLDQDGFEYKPLSKIGGKPPYRMVDICFVLYEVFYAVETVNWKGLIIELTISSIHTVSGIHAKVHVLHRLLINSSDDTFFIIYYSNELLSMWCKDIVMILDNLHICTYCICTVHLPGDGGVFATKHIHRGEFLLQYAGEHIPGVEARRREKHYQKGRRCYMCLYHHNDQEYG